MRKYSVEIIDEMKADGAFLSFVDQLAKGELTLPYDVLYAGRNTIRRYCVQTTTRGVLPVVVKTFKSPNLLQRLHYSFFKKCKAIRAFECGRELQRRGILTPAPLGWVVCYAMGQVSDYCYLSEEQDWPPLADGVLVHGTEPFNRPMAAAFGHFVAQLHERGIIHHDLNSTNVRYRQEPDGSYTFSLIDINRMKFYENGKSVPMSVCLENLTRFTGRLDVFEYVVLHYAQARGLNEVALVPQAIAQKNAHDAAWRRRKRLTHPFRK